MTPEVSRRRARLGPVLFKVRFAAPPFLVRFLLPSLLISKRLASAFLIYSVAHQTLPPKAHLAYLICVVLLLPLSDQCQMCLPFSIPTASTLVLLDVLSLPATRAASCCSSCIKLFYSSSSLKPE